MYSPISRTSMTCVVLLALGGIVQTASAQPEANKAVVLRVVELWNTGDLSIADEIFAADFVSHVPHQPHVTDLESYKAEVIDSRSNVPDLHIEVHDMVAEGDKVAYRITVSGTRQPIGVQYTNPGINIDHFADGKIVEQWWNYDMLGVMEQLGVMPPTRETYIWDEPSAVTGDPGDPEANRALLQRFVGEILNQQDLGLIDELFAADYVMHTAASPVEVRGPEGLKQMLGMYAVAFPDAHVTIDDTVAEEDQVVFRFTMTGTHNGEFMGIPPTGRHITMKGTSIHRFADGKFVETWASDDVLGMMQQLTAEEWSLEGIWIVTVPTPLGNMTLTGNWVAQDAAKTRFTGQFEQISSHPLLIDVYPDAEEVKFAGGLARKVGLNQYEMTALEYFTKTVGPSQEEIVGIGIETGTLELAGPDLAQGQATRACYMAAQDADQDGWPDEGQEPVVCVPCVWTAKRLTMIPGCVPTPIPE